MTDGPELQSNRQIMITIETCWSAPILKKPSHTASKPKVSFFVSDFFTLLSILAYTSAGVAVSPLLKNCCLGPIFS